MATAHGQTIRTQRESLGIRRKELAAKLGISYQHMANIENGHHTAAIELLVHMAKELGLPIGDVVASDWAGVA